MKKIQWKCAISRIIILTVMLCMLIGSAMFAGATEDDVRATTNGVLYFGISYNDDFYGSGSCFLINEDTIVTANHCVHPSEAMYNYYKDKYGASKDVVNKNYKFTVTIERDFTISATVLNSSENMDFAILKLSQPLKNRKALALRDSTTVKAAETAYSIGFPASKKSKTITYQYFNEKDIAIEAGTINRPQYTEAELVGWENYIFSGDVLMLSAGTFNQGNSGGPMVDANGNVIGVVSFSSSAGSCYASAISQVMGVLDTLGIEYSKETGEGNTDSDPKPEVEEKPDYSGLQSSITKAEGRTKEDYTAESYQKLSDALVSAKSALGAKTQNEVDLAKRELENAINNLEQKKSGTNLALIIIIAVVALIIIAVVIVLIVVLGGKKKNDKKEDAAVPAAAHVPEAQHVSYSNTPGSDSVNINVYGTRGTGTVVAPSVSDETTVLSGDGGETTVLSGDGGETTVLSQQVDGGKLIRSSNNEIIPITYSGFTIGKKRREVDYCIGDNTNISRNHAKFIVRDGATFIVDNKSTNGTFVNNSTVRPGTETELKDGDTIMLADEKFEFKK